jgi:inner membrane protein
MKIEISDNKKWQHSFTLKIILLAVMGIFLLIPLELIKSIISERQQNSEKVRQEIAFQWSGKQTVSGPVLNIPVKIQAENEKEKPVRVVYHIMPETLNIKGAASTERRHRSIYEAVVYNSSLNISGEFTIPEIVPEEGGEILWKEAYFTMGISDNRGVKGSVLLKTGAKTVEAIPGLRDFEVLKTGITFPFPANETEKTLPFEINLDLSGSGDLGFTPLGKTTNVSLSSPWESPGFNGNFLPVKREISTTGFSANWLVTNLNRNFPQIWKGNEFNPANDTFGVEFILMADHYQKSLRSAKYGILFIALTFLVLLFAEMSTGESLPVLSYILVSLALVLFFSLLNALSEHIGFNLAYLAASLSTIAMIVLFLRKLVKDHKPVILAGGMLVFLYAFTYILLTLNDYAYLAGNIGLFILLAVTMWLSLKFKGMNKIQQNDIPENL